MADIDHKLVLVHPRGARPQEDTPWLHSADLFRGHRRLVIHHAGEDYYLRLTRNERLILTKN